MPRIESGFIPLPKAEREQPEDNIEIRLNLPSYLDQDRIGVNLSQIKSFSDWGGIRSVRITGKTGEETSSVIPEITGIGPDGSALASKKVAKVEVPIFDSSSSENYITNTLANRQIDVKVDLNIDEMTQRVRESYGEVRSIPHWSKFLDEGIKAPIRKEGHENLLTKLEAAEKISLKLNGLLGLTYNAITYATENKLALAYFFGAYIGNRVVALARARTVEEYRFSVSPFQQIDRAAILSVSSRINSVVKDLHIK